MCKSLKDNRSVHISYELQDRSRLNEAILRLVNQAAVKDRRSFDEFKCVDLGCGRGELMDTLSDKGYKVMGLDMDPKCVEMSSRYGKCICGQVEEAASLFVNEEIDIFILSHILEHTYNPLNVIKSLMKHRTRWLLLAVPNPVRPKVLFKYHLRGKDYCNKGHLYSWDRSHFTNFLETYCGLKIHSWAVDEVYSLPYIRKFLKIVKLDNALETQLLPKLFPYLSSSIIVLCENPV